MTRSTKFSPRRLILPLRGKSAPAEGGGMRDKCPCSRGVTNYIKVCHDRLMRVEVAMIGENNVVSGAQDQTMRMWDLRCSNNVSRVRHDDWVMCVEPHPYNENQVNTCSSVTCELLVVGVSWRLRKNIYYINLYVQIFFVIEDYWLYIICMIKIFPVQGRDVTENFEYYLCDQNCNRA